MEVQKKSRGRKKLDNPRLQKVTFSLEPDLLALYKHLGNGKVINGFRNILLYINKNKSLIEKIKSTSVKSFKAKEFDEVISRLKDQIIK